MKLLAVLLTVYNRKEKTLQCLKNLYAQLPIEGFQMDVYLTNDGCTDGTPQAIEEMFPKVNIIHAAGNLFWNRGMYTAWEVAAKTKNYDYYLWLNDDTFLYNNAIKTIIKNSETLQNNSIVVAAICAPQEVIATYGGRTKDGVISPNGTLQECQTFNGNCVLIPSPIFNRVGNLDWKFRHAIGDLDYGYQVKKAGFKIYSTSHYLGTCESHLQLPAWARKEVPFFKRVKNLYSPLGYAEPIPFFHFELKNFGVLTAMKHFITIHIRLCFPQLWKS